MLQSVGKIIRLSTLSKEAENICRASLAESTQSQYNQHMRDFINYCQRVGIHDHLCVHATTGVEHLTTLFKKGLSYGTINSARSALSQHVALLDNPNMDLGIHPLVNKFMKGLTN